MCSRKGDNLRRHESSARVGHGKGPWGIETRSAGGKQGQHGEGGFRAFSRGPSQHSRSLSGGWVCRYMVYVFDIAIGGVSRG